LYKLNKDKILNNLPKNRVSIDIFEEIDSTNEECKRISLVNDFHVIIAEKQTKGKGRLGKKWSSPPTGNIYMSISTEKELSFGPISLFTGLICKKSIDEILMNKKIGLKWPNDLILEDKKIGGILVETETFGVKIRTIIGIGINFNLPDKESWWGDLSKFKLDNERETMINKIIIGLIYGIEKPSSLWMDEWRDACIHMNKKIEINKNGEHLKNIIFLDIDVDGNAIIKTKKGCDTFTSGEINIKGIY
tara:strand:- start:1209 stop:1952 length:744 start_codon:yes stop_codon:yes gene_type:complete